ncbi:MAG: ComEC/Rec2 family competence protein, partial [Catalinimonas sp.]
MHRRAPHVFVFLIVPFIAGILLSEWFRPDPLIAAGATLLLWAGLLALQLVCPGRKLRNRPLHGSLALVLCVGLGAWRAATVADATARRDLESTQMEAYEAQIEDAPRQKERSVLFDLRVRRVRRAGVWTTPGAATYVRGVLWGFGEDTAARTLRAGDVLVVKGAPAVVPAPENPDVFNYRAYLANKGVHHQHFIQLKDLRRVGSEPGARHFVSHLRTAGAALLREHLTPEAAPVATALSLGVKDDLSAEVKADYATAGVMHILAVSGLHVGILMAMLKWCFGEGRNQGRGIRRDRRWAFLVVSAVVLWSYVALTGFSASVTRAGLMFTVLLVGQAFQRTRSPFNSLALSAFVLLLIDPRTLHQVGFQLSHVAVAGILYGYPRLKALWTPRSRAGRYVWDLLTVSVAAQVATFPLGLLYFHQFPNYFLLANLLVLPLAGVLLSTVFALLILGGLPVVGTIIGGGLGLLASGIIAFINGVLAWQSGLPGALTDGVFYTPAMFWLLVGGLLAALIAQHRRQVRWGVVAGLSLVALVSLRTWDAVECAQQERLEVYHFDHH